MTSHVDPTKTVYQFLKEWEAWRLDGAPELEPFSRSVGLCGNLLNWSDDHDAVRELKNALRDNTEGPYLFPFGAEDYYRRAEWGTQHLCPNRIKWVENFIREYEEAKSNDA